MLAIVGKQVTMEEECHGLHIDVSAVLSTILSELGAVTEYRVLRDSLPQRLAVLLQCRCVLLYQPVGETLQFVAGSFAEQRGWSGELLAVAHINPISFSSALPEARAWRDRRIVYFPVNRPTQVALPLMYRQCLVGVLTAFLAGPEREGQTAVYWSVEESAALEVIAGIVALLLENTRLLERDLARIHELSLLNSISNQINCSPYEWEHLRNSVLQRVREIAHADLCMLVMPAMSVALEDEASWITPALREMLFAHFRASEAPESLIIERPGHTQDTQVMAYLEQLPSDIKTFFALPLLSNHLAEQGEGALLRASSGTQPERMQKPGVPGMIVGGYRQAYKLRREEEMMLQVLANQTCTAMERYHLEEEKRRLDRLALLGEMAANVAHEVRNPLASIKTSMQMLRDDLVGSIAQPEASEQARWAQTSIEVVLKEVERLDAIVRDLLLFARPRQLHRVQCDLTAVCDRVLDLLQPQCAAAKVVVHRNFADLPAVWVDIGQMEQILFNLVTNALQAMPDGGVLTITCRSISPDLASQPGLTGSMLETYSPYYHGTGGSSPQQGPASSALAWVEIAISDTGVGIAPEQIGRIFQPFFTTKAHGIGLGLAITRRLVEDHGGYIRVEGRFGYGATIIVRLPVLADHGQPGEII
jgi:signal transduction histidine kinase